MTPSLEGLPAKAKDAPSPQKVRLASLDTNPVFQSLGFGSVTASKIVVKNFPNENMDMVDVIIYISQTKKQLKSIEREDFESPRTDYCFLNNVKEEEEIHLFQDVKLKGFDNAKTIVSSKKNL